MASIYKPKGRDKWWISYRDATGKRKNVPGYNDKAATVALAKKLETNASREREGLSVTDQAMRFAPIADLTARWLAELESQATSASHLSETRRLLTTLWERCGWANLASVRVDGLTAFLADLKRRGRGPRTLNSYRDALAAFLDYCRRQRWADENPIRERVPKAKSLPGEKTRPRRAYTLAEFVRLLDAAPTRRDAYLAAGLSGLRRKELRLAEKRDLTPTGERPTWHLRASIQKGRRRDVVPIHPELLPTILRLWHRCVGPTDRLFSRMPHAETLRADLARAGIERQDAEGRWLDFHSLRYFFCTQLAQRLPIQAVRLLMRHRDIRQTCNLYCDLGLADLAEDMTAMPPILGAKATRTQGRTHRPQTAQEEE